jgi:hypothetical protein
MTPYGRQGALMRVLDGGGEPALTGEEVMRRVADLIAEHLPIVPFDDPYRGVLVSLVGCCPSHR